MENNSDELKLPKGWRREEVMRKSGIHKGKKKDVYIYSPRGKIFRSKLELKTYIEKNNLPLKIEQFNFSTKKVSNTNNDTVSQDTLSTSSMDLQNTLDSSITSESFHSPPSTPSLTELVAPYVTITPDPPKFLCVEKENIYLRQKVAELKFMIESLTTRTIEIEGKLLERNINKTNIQDSGTQTEKYLIEKICKPTTVTTATQTDTNKKICQEIGNIPAASGCQCVEEGHLCDAVLHQCFADFSQQAKYQNIRYLPPSMVHLIKFKGVFAEIEDHFVAAHDPNTTHVAMAISNSSQADSPGTHWTLLIYSKSTNTFYHLDSIRKSSNHQSAKVTAESLSKMWSFHQNYLYEEVNCVQQQNGIDCGIHTIHNLRLASEIICSQEKISCNERFLEKFVASEMRRSLICPNSKELKAGSLEPQPQNKIIFNTKTKETQTDNIGLNVHTDSNKMYSIQRRGRKASIPKRPINLHGNEIPTSNRFSVLHEETLECTGKSDSGSAHINSQVNPSKKSTYSKSSKSKAKLNISLYTDSLGRRVAPKLEKFNPSEIRAIGSVMSSAGLLQVADVASQSRDSVVVIMGGTNDSFRNDFLPIYSSLEPKLKEISTTKQIILTTIPQRFDLDVKDKVHDDICLANNYIREITERMDQVHLINLDVFKRWHFNDEGVHFSNLGKNKLVHLIEDSLRSMSLIDSSVKSSRNSSKSLLRKRNKIEVIDANMKEVIGRLKNNNNTAFSHCISADFEHPRHMSSGVAVTFRDEIGRPTKSDCVTKYLAYQQVENGAGVFSLITKPRYFLKPYTSDYVQAFCHLAEEFKNKGFEELVCSPMGCVRDNIPVDLFVDQLLKFQRKTNSKIKIIVYEQKGFRTPNSGLNHLEFKRRLQELIASHSSIDVYEEMEKKQEKINTSASTTTAALTAETTIPGQAVPSPAIRDISAFPPLPPPWPPRQPSPPVSSVGGMSQSQYGGSECILDENQSYFLDSMQISQM